MLVTRVSHAGRLSFRPQLAVSALGDEVVLHGAVATALAAAQESLFTRMPIAMTGGEAR